MLFYVREGARVWTHGNHFSDRHLSSLGPVSCIFISWVSSGFTVGNGCSPMAIISQGFFSFLRFLRAHQLLLEGCSHWWPGHPLFNDMAGNIPSLKVEKPHAFQSFPSSVQQNAGCSLICVSALGTLASSEQPTMGLLWTRAWELWEKWWAVLGDWLYGSWTVILRSSPPKEKKYNPNILEGEVVGGDGRQRWQWEESKDLGSLWAGSELLRMVGLEISWWGANPLGWMQGLWPLVRDQTLYLKLMRGLWDHNSSMHSAWGWFSLRGQWVMSTKWEWCSLFY